MNKIYIPYKIGMYYEEVEFEVELLNDRIIGYDSLDILTKFPE